MQNKYEDFIYELIKLLKYWGVWNGCVKIVYGGKTYSPYKAPDITLAEIRNHEIYCKWKIIKELELEKCVFRDLKNVAISDMTSEEIKFQERLSDNPVMYIVSNTRLINLFEYGILETDIRDLPMDRKEEAYSENWEHFEEFPQDFYDEDIRINPEKYGIPSDMEFDSADEYKEFFEIEYESVMEKLFEEYLADLSGHLEYNNELEAEICDLCIKYELHYGHSDAWLFIYDGPCLE